jgi:hypothetical protein
VTAAPRGRGWIVLFHVTADAAWSNLPLSGTFVEMLRRLVACRAPNRRQPPDQRQLSINIGKSRKRPIWSRKAAARRRCGPSACWTARDG